MLVAGGTIASDADAQESGTAAFALRLPDRIENAGAYAFQITIGAFARECDGQ